MYQTFYYFSIIKDKKKNNQILSSFLKSNYLIINK